MLSFSMQEPAFELSATELARHIADYLREMSRMSREWNLESLAQLLERAEIEADLCAKNCISPPAQLLS
jgi:hypothetical protein